MATARILPTPEIQLTRRQNQLREQVTTESVSEAMERVLGRNDLVPIVYLRQGLAAAKAVCLVLVDDQPQGSGFLIGSGLVITNNHVLTGAEQSARGTLRFNYQLNEQGNVEPTATFKLRPDLFFACSEPDALDYAVVAVEPISLEGNHQLTEYGALPLSTELGKALDGEFMTIIQHPNGFYKKIGLRENKFIGFADSAKGASGNQWYMDYTTDTLPGSSGAPVVNDQWQLVALHSRGVEARDAAGNVLTKDDTPYQRGVDDAESIQWVSNRGIRSSKILLDLTTRYPHDPRISSLPGTTHPAAGGPIAPGPSGAAGGAAVSPPVTAYESVHEQGLPIQPAANSLPSPEPMDATGITFVLPLAVTFRLGQPGQQLAQPTLPQSVGLALPAPAATATGAFESMTSSRADYSSRVGYDKDFLALRIDLEMLLDKFIAAKKLAPLLDAASGPLLTYTHFSTAQHRSRRMAVLTAVNIQGKDFEEIKRTKDVWILDPRMDAAYQTGPAVYQKNDLDRGHMVRRQDPDWGADALLANEDTFHYTNSCPQHKDLNRKEWNVLEDYVLNAAKDETLNVSVFTGPVFGENDKPFRDVLLPLQFWKIAVLIKSNGTPSASGFMLSQAAMLTSLDGQESIADTGFTTYQTYQVSLRHITELTGLSFDTLFQYDPLQGVQPFESVRFVAIKSSQDIRL